MRLALLLLSLAACGSSSSAPAPAPHPVPSTPTPAASEETIGSATMEPDRTIVLQLRATGEGAVGDALIRYPPTHPQYQSILEHVGSDMQPGQSRPVRPFPE